MPNLTLETENPDLVRIEDAARIVGKTPHNLRDYIQRGRISKYNPKGERIHKAGNGELRVSLKELEIFLSLVNLGLEKHHQAGLQPELGFYNLPEYLRTKHVHRLHPYLGKFIPQLVEWFLVRHFKENDIILDPFMGSGTTLIQANELRMHAIGIDISEFNCRIAKVKTSKYDIDLARKEILDTERRLSKFSQHLTMAPGADFDLFPEERLEKLKASLGEECKSDYLKKWFAPRTIYEIFYYRRLIKEYSYQDLLKIVLSRAVRSCRLIPHYDLATPKSPLPVGVEYWCRKHNRMCKPIAELLAKIHAYSEDTARRIEEFNRLRSEKQMIVLQGDSRCYNLDATLTENFKSGSPIDGIFSSPPYVGQIDYHDQHIYAYEIFGFPRYDDLEIGAKKTGKSVQARKDYIENISKVLINTKQFLSEQAKIFIVANDKFRIYPEIAKKSKLKIIEEYKRAVTKRTEQGDDPYHESIFLMMKEK